MLHKVNIGHFVIDEIGRKRPAFTEVIVEADSGDEAAVKAIAEHGEKLANPPGSSFPMKVGVCGIDCPTAEERAAWEAGRKPAAVVYGATGHGDEFTPIVPSADYIDTIKNSAIPVTREDVDAMADPETAQARAAYDEPVRRGPGRPRKVVA